MCSPSHLSFCQIEDMFKPVLPLLASYTSYVSNYHRSVPLLHQHSQPGTNFKKYLDQPLMRRSLADLSSKLVMPVQRLPRCVSHKIVCLHSSADLDLECQVQASC